MQMVQVKNGQITLRSVPSTYTHEDGSTTLGYNLLSIEELSKDGWVEVVEIKPEYNQETQHLTFDNEIIEDNKVIVNYKVVDIVISPIVPTEIDLIKAELAEQKLQTQLLDLKLNIVSESVVV